MFTDFLPFTLSYLGGAATAGLAIQFFALNPIRKMLRRGDDALLKANETIDDLTTIADELERKLDTANVKLGYEREETASQANTVRMLQTANNALRAELETVKGKSWMGQVRNAGQFGSKPRELAA